MVRLGGQIHQQSSQVTAVLLIVSRSLTRVLKDRYPAEQTAQAYIDQLTSLGQRA